MEKVHVRKDHNRGLELRALLLFIVVTADFLFIPAYIFLPAFLCLFTQVSSAQSSCADQVQRCGKLVEEFERQIQDVKTVAFRNCFTKTPCVQERIAFEDCFRKSLRSVRNTNTATNESIFSPTVKNYQSQLEQCFEGGQQLTSSTSSPSNEQALASVSVDEDAIYARAIYSTEYADRLWGLAEAGPVKASLNSLEACLVKDLVTRVFGGGISRIVDSSRNPNVNNLNTSCMLTTEELRCYQRSLDEDNQFQQMLQNRDRALRSCIQSIRIQADCHKGDSSRIRSCVCNAREEFDSRMQAEILECMKHTSVAKLYTAIVDLSNGVIPEDFPLPNQPEFRFKQARPEPTDLQHSEDPVSISSTATITPGVTINGQCLCTCSQQQNPRHTHKQSLNSFASSSDIDYTSRLQSADAQVDGNSGISQSRHHIQPQAVFYSQPQQQLYSRATYYQQQQQQPSYYQPTSSVLNTESGIANGFERFFSGLPPIR